TDIDRYVVDVDEQVATRVALDEAGRQLLPLDRVQPRDGGARGIRRDLLDGMHRAEIDAVGGHPHDEEEIEGTQQRKFDGRRTRSVRKKAAEAKGSNLPTHASRKTQRRQCRV